MNIFFHRIRLAALLLRDPALLFDTISRDSCYAEGILDWVYQLRLQPESRILELGCGPGALAIELSHRGHFVTAVDRSEKMLARLRRNVNGRGVSPKVLKVDVCSTDLPEGSFDAVIGASILNVVTDKAALLAEAIRVAKPGGLLSFYVPTQEMVQENVHRYIAHHSLAPSSAAILLTWQGKARKLSGETVMASMKQAGLERLSVAPHLAGMTVSVTGFR